MIVDSQPSSSSTTGLDLLNGVSTLVKAAYPFTTTANETVTTQPMSFIVGPNVVNGFIQFQNNQISV